MKRISIFLDHVHIDLGVRVRGGVSDIVGSARGRSSGRRAVRHRRVFFPPGRAHHAPRHARGFKNSLIKPRGFKKSCRGSSSPGSVPPAGRHRRGGVLWRSRRISTGMSTIVAAQQQAAAAAGAGDVSADKCAPCCWPSCLSPCSWARAQHLHDVRRGGAGAATWCRRRLRACASCRRAAGHGRDLGFVARAAHHHRAQLRRGVSRLAIRRHRCHACSARRLNLLTYVTVRTGSCLAAALSATVRSTFVSAGIMFSLTGGNLRGTHARGHRRRQRVHRGRGPHAVGWPPREAGTLAMPQAGLTSMTKADLARTAS